MLSFMQWLDGTAWSTALHESLYMYPLVESTHVLTLMLFVGMTVMWDLRLLGLAFTNVPISELSRRILPWSRAGFYIMIVTGGLLLFAIPVRTYQNVFFRAKMIMFALALLNIWYFHRRTERSIAAWDTAATPPRAAKVAAVASITLWFLIVVAGRMIAYNWFDCDIQPQPGFINRAAGCVVPPAK
ncbi:MAG TPA: DUF6644 family protein [Vicinamibacterales bacterium]|nr:DUF6644 family protein [Vicinamibacterales bacterium]